MICYLSYVNCILVASVIYIFYIAFFIELYIQFLFCLTVGHSPLLFLLYLTD